MPRQFNRHLLKRLMDTRRPPVTPAQLARGISVHRDTVAGWVEGTSEPSLSNAETAAAFLGVTLDFFMVEEGEAPLDPQAASR